MGAQVDYIALSDEPSRAAAPTWERIMGFCFLARQVSVADVRAVLAELDRTDTLMPIVDPTGYRAIMGNVAQHREVAAAHAGQVGQHRHGPT